MEEHKACAWLKQRFEAAGFAIAENVAFDEAGIRFELDGFDAERRVGYEYVTAEAGDGWDVDAAVIAALDARRQRGELYILVVDEAQAPDQRALDRSVDGFLGELKQRGVVADGKARAVAAKPAPARPAAKVKPAAKARPAAKPARKPKARR